MKKIIWMLLQVFGDSHMVSRLLVRLQLLTHSLELFLELAQHSITRRTK